MSDFVIPDMIEPIVAHRLWKAPQGELLSLRDSSVWPKKKRMEATCAGSEPTTTHTVGWEAVPHIGETVWVRDGRPEEGLERGTAGATGPAIAYATAAASAVTYIPTVIHMEPLPTEPSALILPGAWKYRIAYRQELLPPRHTQSPAESCQCGIYALKSAHAAAHYAHSHVLGEVYLWGKVIEGEDGYRAQYAYPKSLTVTDHSVDRDSLEEYGVPVEKASLQVAIPAALHTSSPWDWIKSAALAMNLVAIVLVSIGFLRGNVGVVNEALLVLNVVALLSLSRRARKLAIGVLGIVLIVVSSPVSIVMMVTGLLCEVLPGSSFGDGDWWFDHCPFAAVDWALDKAGW